MARIIPVIDVMNGQVVRAVGGRRDEYRPLVSKLTSSTDPLVVARVLSEPDETDEVYLADLDAIQGRPACAVKVVETLVGEGFDVWVDAGVRGLNDGREYHKAGGRVILGTETVAGPEVVRDWLGPEILPPVSLDLSAGQLLGDWRAWGAVDPTDVLGAVETILELGVRRLFVIDLDGVGSATGPATADVCLAIRLRFQGWSASGGRLFSGGGVRDWKDVSRLEECGVDAVLAASALHEGTLSFPRPAEYPRRAF